MQLAYEVFEMLLRFTSPLNMLDNVTINLVKAIIDEVYDYINYVEIYHENLVFLSKFLTCERKKVMLITNVDVPQFFIEEVLKDGSLKIKVPSEMNVRAMVGKIFLIPTLGGLVKGLAYEYNKEYVFLDAGFSEDKEALDKGLRVNSIVTPYVKLERIGSTQIVGWPLSRVIGLILLLTCFKELASYDINVYGLIVLGKYSEIVNRMISTLVRSLDEYIVFFSSIDFRLNRLLNEKRRLIIYVGGMKRVEGNISLDEIKYLVEQSSIPFYNQAIYIMVPVKYINTLHEAIDLQDIIHAQRLISALIQANNT